MFTRKVYDRFLLMVMLENDSMYAVKLSGEIVSEGIISMRDLSELVNNRLFDENGNVSPKLLEKIKNKNYIQKALLVKLKDEFDAYYNKYEDVNELREDGLSDLNIKIIFSEEYDIKARYYQYYKNQEKNEWEEVNVSSPLRYDERYASISKNEMDDLITQLCNATALGDCNTSIFFVGDKTIFDVAKFFIENKFGNAKVFYLE